ncbi:MAG: peptidyl-prolyl cis-trans isomerase, partial [Deltaproteobacteria bacterium]|nr:peptidyl-prolyl cis-trans isomerase [Deltaproteobacteria bacterium]
GIIGSGSLAAYLGAHPETKVVETDYFSQKTTPDGLPSDPQFLERAFALNEGELSSLVETAKGYAIISMASIKQPEIPELSEVRERAVTDYKTEKSADMARRAAENLIDDLNKENSSFETLAHEIGLSLQQSGSLEKNSSSAESSFPQELVANVFRLSASNPISKEPAVVGQDYYVYQFTSRNPPQTPLSADDRQRYHQQLLQYKQQQVMEAWLINQQAQSEVYTHPSLQNF